jgi:hypothetical protein
MFPSSDEMVGDSYFVGSLELALFIGQFTSGPEHLILVEDQACVGEVEVIHPSLARKELKAIKSLKLNKDITIVQAEKGSCSVVLDGSEYKDKLNTLLRVQHL